MTFKSDNVVYVLLCNNCNTFYIVEIKNQLNLQINLHCSHANNPTMAPFEVSNYLASYRPISNLHHISKLLDRCVSKQLHRNPSKNSYYEPFQSAYHPHHSTETAFLHVQNDSLVSMDKQEITLLVLLDLSAAFD